MNPDEVPDLQEERLRRAFKRWLQEDEEGRAILDELRHDPERGRQALRDRLARDAPELSTRLGGSSSVGKLVNVASELASVHIHEAETGPVKRPLLRLFLQSTSSSVSVGSADPCLVRARVANEDAVDHEVELKVTDWLGDVSEIQGAERFVLPSGGHRDVRIAVAIAPEQAVNVPAREYNLEVQAIVVDPGRRSVWATESVALDVLPFQWIDSRMEPAERLLKHWNRHWLPYQLLVHNRGNSDAQVTVGHRPGPSSVQIDVVDETMSLPPDGRQQVPVRVRPVRRNLLAERAHVFQLFTAARPQHENEVSATLRQVPPVSKRTLTTVLAIIALLALGVVNQLQSDRGSEVAASVGAPAPAVSVDAQAPPSDPLPTSGRAATGSELIAVVEAFYDAVNAAEYRKAWDLLDDRKLGMRSYEAFAAGYADTKYVDLRILGLRGSTVEVELAATEHDGRQRTVYRGWYRVENGQIVEGRQKRVNRTSDR
jgi:hypothetical protein